MKVKLDRMISINLIRTTQNINTNISEILIYKTLLCFDPFEHHHLEKVKGPFQIGHSNQPYLVECNIFRLF